MTRPPFYAALVEDDDNKKFNIPCFLILFPPNSITYIHLPVGSKWLYVGTEKGNIHIVNTESFTLSGYTIHWNKAVELWVPKQILVGHFITLHLTLTGPSTRTARYFLFISN